MNRVLSLKILLASLVIVAYSSLSLFGVLQMSQSSHTGHTATPCPYMIGEQGLCPMDLFDHIASWQQFSNAVFPAMNILVLSLVVMVGFWLYLSSSPPLSYLRLHRRKFTEPLYQSLFSSGILNSKAF